MWLRMANMTYVNINLRRKLCYFCGIFFCLHRSREGIRYQTEKITSNFSQFFLILFREGEKYLIHPLSLSLTRMPYLRNVNDRSIYPVFCRNAFRLAFDSSFVGSVEGGFLWTFQVGFLHLHRFFFVTPAPGNKNS